MITYNWKAEFCLEERERIKTYQQRAQFPTPLKHIEQLSDINLIAEMANALDRYEAILNEDYYESREHENR